ncbi:MAG: DMT family transporter [Actinomycetota bacterium]
MKGFTRHHALMVLPVLFWAGNALVGRATVGQVPPLALSFWRWFFALLLILPFTFRDILESRAVIRANWAHLVGMGLFSVAAYNTLLYVALQTTTAINALIVAASLPVMILILSRLWLAEPVRPAQVVGIAVSLSGVLAVIAEGSPARLAQVGLTGGDGLVLLAVLSWAIYSVMLRRRPVPMGGLALLTVLIAVGVVAILPLYLWELAGGAAIAPHWSSWAAIAYTAVFPSLLAYALWNRGVAALGAAVAGQFTYLMPLFTAVLAVLLLDEHFRWYHAAGGGLIFAGIWLATAARR